MEKVLKCIAKGDEDALARALGDLPDPNAFGKKKLAPIHAAVQSQDSTILSVVLEDKRVDVNLQDQDAGLTPLIHCATSSATGDEHAAAALLKAGAKINNTDVGGRTVLHWAAKMGQEDFITFLLKRQAKLDLQDNEGKTALMSALEDGQGEAALLFVSKGAEVNLKDEEGKTALLIAIERRLPNVCMEILAPPEAGSLKKECDRSVQKDAQGNGPLHYCRRLALDGLASILEKKGFSPNETNAAGQVPEDFVKERKKKEEEAKQEKIQAKQDKQVRKRHQAEAALEATEVTAFCRDAGVSQETIEALFAKKYKFVDDAFLGLEENDFKKIGVKNKEDVEKIFEKFRQKEEAEREAEEEELRRQVEEIESQKRKNAFIAFGFIVLVFLVVYIVLSYFINMKSRGRGGGR
mmetsp:Transcript_16167/g.32739  ORF Transcript_16167/g.32739 Transcript_16167/m.32739 type:complete len:409 (-) Transcript_16167:364-1590(-)